MNECQYIVAYRAYKIATRHNSYVFEESRRAKLRVTSQKKIREIGLIF